MGLTILAFIAAFLLALLAFYTAKRSAAAGAITPAQRVVVFIDAALAAFSLFHGLAFTLVRVGSGGGDWPLWLELASGACLFIAHAALIYFTTTFPTPRNRIIRLTALAVSLAAAGYAAYRILGTSDFAVRVFVSPQGVARIDGPRFRMISGVMAGIGSAAALALAAHAFLSKDRISRQRAAVAAVGLAVGISALWLLSGALPTRAGMRQSYSITPIAALLLGAVLTYAYGLSRIFDWRAIGRSLASYAILYAAVGLPTGLVAYLIFLLRTPSPTLASIVAIIVFLTSSHLAHRLSSRFLERVSARGEYREELESALSHVDMAAGRDAVLAELKNLLCAALDFAEFNVLIEDDHGTLKTIYSTSDSRAAIERNSELGGALESAAAPVLLKSEAQSAPAYAGVRAELLELFDALKAEAIIVAREGRHAIGAFSLGPRLTGAEYTAYDYATLKTLYGKLFVFAYYLKNIARESLLHTVDREIALSDQVIHFALEKVDRITSPGVDTAWFTRSTRRLGGDFVDFVRMTKDRWFFVIGDVSGKGLSASMNMLILKSMVRTFLRIEKGFIGLVGRVNSFIKENLPRGTFFAGAFGYFDFAEGNLYYINCGIPVIFLYSPGFDTFIEVQGEGRVLGFVRDVTPFLKPRKIALPPGSVLAIATDGVTDSENIRGDRFGKERFRRSVRERLAASSREIADGVAEDLLNFLDRKQEDDITLLVMKISERSPE